MEKRPRRPGLMERASQALDLPADLLAGAEFVQEVGAAESTYQEIYTAFKNQ